MDNQDILERIKDLVEEEHGLREGSAQSGGTGGPDILRLQQVEEQLDQCWDLLRQRDALRSVGKNPDDATVRPAEQVEGYRN